MWCPVWFHSHPHLMEITWIGRESFPSEPAERKRWEEWPQWDAQGSLLSQLFSGTTVIRIAVVCAPSLSLMLLGACFREGVGGVIRWRQIDHLRVASFCGLSEYLESTSDFTGTQQVLGARGSRKNMPCAFLALNEFTVPVTDLRPGRIQPWNGWNSSAYTFLKYYMWIQLSWACFPLWP